MPDLGVSKGAEVKLDDFGVDEGLGRFQFVGLIDHRRVRQILNKLQGGTRYVQVHQDRKNVPRIGVFWSSIRKDRANKSSKCSGTPRMYR